MAVNSASSFSVDPNAYNQSSFNDYYHQYMKEHYPGALGNDVDPYSIGGRIQNLTSGSTSSAEREYDRYLTNEQRRYEQDTLAKAREYEMYMSNTAYQRMVADLKAAGLNPWLAVQSGLSASSNSASAQGSSSKAENKRLNQSSNSAKGFLGAIIGILRLIALIA